MELLEEQYDITKNVKLSDDNKKLLKSNVGEIYALGYQMASERNRFNSDEAYEMWRKGKPSENYLDRLNELIEKITNIFESEKIETHYEYINNSPANPTIIYRDSNGLYTSYDEFLYQQQRLPQCTQTNIEYGHPIGTINSNF